MNMIKTLALAVLTPTLAKAVSEGYEWMCEKFGCEDDPKPPIKRKSPDRSLLSVEQKQFVRKEFRSYLTNRKTTSGVSIKNTEELTTYFNQKFNCNKSRSVYAKIWKVK